MAGRRRRRYNGWYWFDALDAAVGVALVFGAINAVLAVIPSTSDPPGRNRWDASMMWVELCWALPFSLIAGTILGCQFFPGRHGRRELRWMRGQCTRCGYDLRASPDRCPECGQVPSSTN